MRSALTGYSDPARTLRMEGTAKIYFCHRRKTAACRAAPNRGPAPAQSSAALLPYGCGVALAGTQVRFGKEEQGSGRIAF